MGSAMTRRLIVAATLANSFHAGSNVNRALVEMPAWRKIGVQHWAAFSRHADLGPVARVLYPLAAFAGAGLSLGTALSVRRDRSEARSAVAPCYAAAALSIGGLLATTQAAPRMLSVGRVGDDTAALQRAFDGFERWGGIRGVLQVLAFVANVCALVATTSPAP